MFVMGWIFPWTEGLPSVLLWHTIPAYLIAWYNTRIVIGIFLHSTKVKIIKQVGEWCKLSGKFQGG